MNASPDALFKGSTATDQPMAREFNETIEY